MKTSICLIEANLKNEWFVHIRNYFDYNQISIPSKDSIKDCIKIESLSVEEIAMWSHHAHIQNDLAQGWYLVQFSIVDYYGLYCKKNHSQIETPLIIKPDQNKITELDKKRQKVALGVFPPF